MTTHRTRPLRLLAISLGTTLLFAGAASAVKPTKDGKTCTDPRKIVVKNPLPQPQQGNQAPDPKDDPKKWRDYILGNKKPPIRPKGQSNDNQQEVQFKIQMGTSDLQNAESVRSRALKRGFKPFAAAAPQGGTNGNQAPDPKDPPKKWRDYINGNKKPPVRPKP